MMPQWAAIERVLAAAKAYDEVRAVFLKGSLATTQGDQYSDIDFYCLVDDENMSSFLPKRLELLAAYRPIIYHSHADFVGPQIIAVYDNGLHFDLYTVTPATFPSVGRFKALYDPNRLLDQFASSIADHSLTSSELVEQFNEFSFSLLEFAAAWQRGDWSWSNRLASHLAGHLSLVLRHYYDPANGRLGMKRLESVLPSETRMALREALKDCASDNQPAGVKQLSDLLKQTMLDLEKQGVLTLDWALFDFMQQQLNSLAQEGC